MSKQSTGEYWIIPTKIINKLLPKFPGTQNQYSEKLKRFVNGPFKRFFPTRFDDYIEISWGSDKSIARALNKTSPFGVFIRNGNASVFDVLAAFAFYDKENPDIKPLLFKEALAKFDLTEENIFKRKEQKIDPIKLQLWQAAHFEKHENTGAKSMNHAEDIKPHENSKKVPQRFKKVGVAQTQIANEKLTPIRKSQTKQPTVITSHSTAIEGNWRGEGVELKMAKYPTGYTPPRYRTEVTFNIKLEGKHVFVAGFMTSYDHKTNEIRHRNVKFTAKGELRNSKNALLIYDVHHKEFDAYGVISARFYGIGQAEWCIVAFRANEEERGILRLLLKKHKK